MPVTPGDAGLDAKIHTILTDVDLILPTAAALLIDERCGRNQRGTPDERNVGAGLFP